MAAFLTVLAAALILGLISYVLQRRGHAPWQSKGEATLAGPQRPAGDAVAAWRQDTDAPQRPWREARIKSSALDRFTGPPFPERPPLRKERYSISHGRRTEFEGLTMLAYELCFRKSSSVTGPFYYAMIVSLDIPQWNSRVAVDAGAPSTVNNFRLGVPGFDAARTVHTDDDAFARRVLGRDLAYWLATDRHYAPLNFVLENGTLSTWLTGHFDDDALDLLTEALVRFRRLIPPEH